jgi:methylmalonyl-CoA/ethylmalonyl-CoA epimerase
MGNNPRRSNNGKTSTMTPKLHHIGILVGDIPKAADAYAARYGYRAADKTIHDPVQTAHVLFLEGDPSGVRLELITPDGPNSKLSNALKKGGGLNHFCYLSEDIDKDCADLRSTGMFLLQSPVAAEAFPGRRIAWLMGRDGIPVELVESEQAQ